jgi:hypothetical protein
MRRSLDDLATMGSSWRSGWASANREEAPERWDDSFADLLPDVVQRLDDRLSAGWPVAIKRTQGIRGQANRRVLERINESGGLFFARSDEAWVLAGANVHISFVGQDCPWP